MTTGTKDKKKLGFLTVLAVVAGYMVYSNLFSGPSTGAGGQGSGTARRAGSPADVDSGAPVPVPSTPAASQPMAPDVHRAAPTARPKSEEFRPALRSKRKEEQINPIDVDPTLRTDLLAKVQAVKFEGGQRNLFQFGSIQPVETPVLKGPEPKIPLPGTHLMGPMPVPEEAPKPPTIVTEAPPPPIPYKYYGLSTTRINGRKTAFFLDGEDIILATEGMVVKKRYKVVRIGITSVVMEDVDSKKQQTVNYTEEAQNASGG
ncbi:MAG TPA: hypothetical protein VNY05_40705 [Candidatus Acidoferrales bacterium]|jgi:hypothetical protein|nr:hypothetical protein [Candidatus Acidoferrales bacterium]